MPDGAVTCQSPATALAPATSSPGVLPASPFGVAWGFP